MLAGIKISDGSSKHKDSKKKKKKSKHKKRKLKKAKESSSSDSDSSGGADDGEAVELQTAPAATTTSVVRDTWMTLPMKSPHMTAVLTDRAAKRDAEEKKKQEDEEAREVLEQQAKIGGLKGDIRPINEKSLTAAPLVGDGGAKWRAKALLRAQERAKEEGVDGETVIAERFGSLGAFKAKDRELKNELHNQRGYSDKAREEQRHRFQRAGGSNSNNRGSERSERGERGEGGGREGGREGGRGERRESGSSWHSRAEEQSRRRETVIPEEGQDEFGRDLGEGESEAQTSVSAAVVATVGVEKSERSRASEQSSSGSNRQERWRRKDFVSSSSREEREGRGDRDTEKRGDREDTEKRSPPRRRSRDREKEDDRRKEREDRDREREREDREREREKKDKEAVRERERRESEKHEKRSENTEKIPAKETKAETEELDPKKLAKKAQKEAEEAKEIAERRAFLYSTNRSRTDTESKQASVSSMSKSHANDQDEGEEEDEGPEISDADMNKLAARALKASLMGETEKAKTLEQQLASIKARKARQPKVAVLSEMDAKGRLLNLKRPAGVGGEAKTEEQGNRKQKRVQNKMVDGERVAYFDDDVAKTDLKSLVEAERLRGAEDYDANWAKNIMKNADYKAVSLEQQWDDVDVSMKMFQSKKDRLQKDKQAEYVQKTQIAEYNKLQRTLDNCRLCVAQAPPHLIIANGLKMYLSLPTHRLVTEGHCILAPVDHTPALTHFDEEVIEEFQYFRKHLVKMFAKQGKGVVFMETFMHPDRTPHACIECVPLPRDLFEEAAIYFKKEISDSDAKWSVHKKLIDTREKGLRRLVAKQAPYFSVEFGMEAGFAHVIEDTSKFPMDFGKSVLCGILEEPAQIVMRAKRQPEHMERERAEAFRQKWKPYDWTLKLKKNQPNSSMQEEA